MLYHIKNIITTLTILAYTNMVLTEDVYRELPKTNEENISPFILWQRSLVTDTESYDKELKYNRQFNWDNKNDLDPLFGI